MWKLKISRSLLTSIFLRKFWNSLTFPWLFSFFKISLTENVIPWPGNFFIFQNFFPDRGNPAFCPSSPNIVRTFGNCLGHFLTLFLPLLTDIAICPSQIETRGSFATIWDGKCGLIDCLAFYSMRRLELVDRWKCVGYCFLLLFAAAARLTSHGKWLFR